MDDLDAGGTVEQRLDPAGLGHLDAAIVTKADEEDARPDSTKVVFEGIPCPDLARAEYQIEYLVKDMLVAGQPCILGGAQKTLKTTIAWDLAISLCTGRPFLNRFEVLRAARVVYMSGEGGLAVLQDIGRRVCGFKHIELSDVTGMAVCDRLPQLDNKFHLDALAEFITQHEAEAIFIDPVYLAMSGADAGNVLSMGERLGAVNETCAKVGATPILLHHTKKVDRRDPFAVPTLTDLSWSGFAEFAAQWLLLSRRSEYTPNPAGAQELTMSAGGRMGHSSLWALNVQEGLTGSETGRYWHVDVLTPNEAKSERGDRQEEVRATKQQDRLDADRKRVADALAKFPKGGTKNVLRTRAGMSGTRLDVALADLLNSGEAVECDVLVSNQKTPRPGYKLSEET